MHASIKSADIVSSIGSQWPPVPTFDSRLAGLYPKYVEPRGINDLISDFRDYNFGMQLRNSGPNSRLVVGAVMSNNATEQIAEIMPSYIEAAVPLTGGYEDNNLVFIGSAHTGRNSLHPDLIENYQENIEATKKIQPISPVITTAESHNLIPHIAKPDIDDQAFEQLEQLQRFTKFGKISLSSIIRRSNNAIMYLTDEERNIVALAGAECLSANIKDLGRVNVIEFTGTAVRHDYANKGYHRIASSSLIKYIKDRSSKYDARVHAIYSEYSLESGSQEALEANVENGWQLSYFDNTKFNIDNNKRSTPFGILPHHASINGILQSFAVGYLHI